MAKLKIVVWKSREPSGEPEVEVTIPTYLAKWASKMMRFIPKNKQEELWGDDIDLKDVRLDELIGEALEKGESEIMEVKAPDAHVKIYLER